MSGVAFGVHGGQGFALGAFDIGSRVQGRLLYEGLSRALDTFRDVPLQLTLSRTHPNYL